MNECGGSLPTDEVDDDDDGYVECTLDSNGWDGVGSKSGDDCDDGDDTIYPSAQRFAMVKRMSAVVLYL